MKEGDLLALLNVFIGYSKSDTKKFWCQKNFINFKAMRRATEIRIRMENMLQQYEIPLVSCRGKLQHFLIITIFITADN